MEIVLSGIAKSFGREQVIGNLTHTLASGSRTAILGANGSGKSTLLQLIAGSMAPTAGTIEHRLHGTTLDADGVYPHVSIAAPYLGLYEELALDQAVDFHARFKPLRKGIGTRELAGLAYLNDALHKPIRHFSSGMKQRLKLALAILSDTPLLLLDEPASNLDARAVAWYRDLLQAHVEARTLVIASNRQAVEHDLCSGSIEVERSREGV